MRRFFLSFVVSLNLFASLALADVLRIKPDAPLNYVVKKGDTLWDISAIYLEKPWHWPKLWQSNPHIANPHLIYPGDRLSLVFDGEGNPKLIVAAEPAEIPEKPEAKLEPRIRKTQKEAGAYVQAISDTALRPFLEGALLLNADEMEGDGFVLSSDSGFKTMSTGDNIAIKGNLNAAKYHVIRLREIIENDDGEVLGALYDKLAIATVNQVYQEDNVSKAVLSEAVFPVKQGDMLVEFQSVKIPELLKFSEPATTTGKIVAADNMQRYHGKWEVVVLDRGAKDNLAQGQIYSVVQSGPNVVVRGRTAKYSDSLNVFGEKIQTPTFEIGELIVIKPLDKLSVALITKATQPISLLDKFIGESD